MTHEEIARTLRSAVTYLNENGWRADDYGSHGGPRCIAGAIASVLQVDLDRDWQNDSDFSEEESRLEAFLQAAFNPLPSEIPLAWDRISSIATWNDSLPQSVGREKAVALLNAVADAHEKNLVYA